MQVTQCVNCGARSVPYFGFFAPCRADSLGGHRAFEQVEADELVIARRLATAYSSVPWFDRVKFDKYASLEAKALLSRGNPQGGNGDST